MLIGLRFESSTQSGYGTEVTDNIDGHQISLLRTTPFRSTKMFVAQKSISEMSMPAMAYDTFAMTDCVLSLTNCLEVSYRPMSCSIGCCSDSRNFPISSPGYCCSTAVALSDLAVNFDVPKFSNSARSDGFGFT
ncbi:MAG: hypothetical protein EZS28_046604 [Streblomastix strix]|uniref:Uncharacterized protein n=1 Tax=Streblomastix strix TaxID=222440 RepID=A0A5J4TJC8_9EUKA|nr:MAG: hypothetical protein EZS28_046604 [Streblomastix strix]